MLSVELLLESLQGPIIIVGNGPIFRNSGAFIDSHTHVMRINNYQIDPYQNFVGSKTSFRVVNTWEDLHNYNHTLELCPFKPDSVEASNAKLYCEKSDVPVVFPDLDVHELLAGYSRPSTGLAVLAICDHLRISVNAIGFSGLEGGHYFDPKAQSCEVHNPKKEIEAYSKLTHVNFI